MQIEKKISASRYDAETTLQLDYSEALAVATGLRLLRDWYRNEGKEIHAEEIAAEKAREIDAMYHQVMFSPWNT